MTVARPGRVMIALAAGIPLLALSLLAWRLDRRGPRGVEAPSRVAARQLYRQARAAALELQVARQTSLAMQAIRADPTYLPAIALLSRSAENLPAPLLDSLVALPRQIGDPTAAACLRGFLAVVEGGRAGSVADRDCAALLESFSASAAVSDTVLERLRALSARYPESLELRREYGSGLSARGRWEELVRSAKVLRETSSDPAAAATAVAEEAMARHLLLQHAEALRIEEAGEARFPGWPPQAQALYLDVLAAHLSSTSALSSDTTFVKHAHRVMAGVRARDSAAWARGDDAARRANGFRQTESLIDSGELVAAVTRADQVLANPSPDVTRGFIAWMRVLRGRALVKLGRPGDAEADLHLARALTATGPFHTPAMQAEHNLFHLYEGLRRDVEARRAGLAFVRLAQLWGRPPLRMISRRDLAWFLAQRGRLDEARPHFQAMVALIDSMRGYYYYAGEYHELVGDLDRAAAEYRQSIEEAHGQDASRAYAGLVRVLEARGDSVRAERYARIHDYGGINPVPEEMPLLPALLASSGRYAEATAELERARGAAARAGQMASWSTLTADQGEAELRLGHFQRASALADSGAAAADRVGLPAVGERGRALAALARIRAGAARPSALRALAAAAASPAGTPLERSDRYRALGDGRAWLRDLAGALQAYGRAADIVDSVAPSLVNALERAQFRARQLGITSAALSAILVSPRASSAPALFARWSVRRKARVLLEAAPAAGEDAAPDPARLASSLAPDQALVDYVLLEDRVAALVVTRAGARIVALPITPAALLDAVATLRAPLEARVGTRLDTARARYPMGAAALLYDALLRPLDPLLGPRHRLIVVPDGPLHLVPFAGLVVRAPPEAGQAATFAVERFSITTALSLAAPALGDRPLPGGRALVVLDRALPGGAAEVIAIQHALRGRPLELLDGKADPETVRHSATRAAILHFAVHARANLARPDLSALALPGAHGGEPLEAGAIATMELRGRLIVLSGCETGGGAVVNGEGVMSLSRAFLAAGAAATIATTWSVGPATADVMGALYEALAGGAPAAEALRTAQLRLLAAHASPLAWAPFVYVARSH